MDELLRRSKRAIEQYQLPAEVEQYIRLLERTTLDLPQIPQGTVLLSEQEMQAIANALEEGARARGEDVIGLLLLTGAFHIVKVADLSDLIKKYNLPIKPKPLQANPSLGAAACLNDNCSFCRQLNSHLDHHWG